MGTEAPEYLTENIDRFPVVSYDSNAQGYQTSSVIGNKIYVIGEAEEYVDAVIGVKIYDKLTEKWCLPTILGTKPIQSKGHSAVLVDKNRILILKRGSFADDCIWFLEVDTPFVKEQKKLLGTEVVAWSKGISGDGLKPIVISGPSGVGKGTLISKLMNEFPATFGFSVSHTTRAPREREVNGIHYHFSERSQMEKDIREGKFLESASVHGNLYGTSIEAVEAVTDVGKRCILDIDVQGARSVRASSLEAIFIFICPPSFEELEKRLRSRGTETEEQVQKRLRNAEVELKQGKTPGLFDHILVNENLKACYQNLKNLLALDETSEASCKPAVKNFKVSVNHCVSKQDQKILISCDDTQSKSSTPITLALDLSSLKGGAPGRTRGLIITAINSSLDSVNEVEQI